MKRFMTLLAAIVLAQSFNTLAEPLTLDDGLPYDEFEYTLDGYVTAYYGGEVVSIPSEIDGIPIRVIGDEMCFDLGISTVYTNNGLEEIGKSAFEGSNIIYVDISSTVNTVSDRAFANCEELETVVLNSDDILFGDDAFAGTGYIEFTIPCTADEDALAEKISIAKGDSYFCFTKMHTALTESMTEKDIFGENMIYCSDCGFKGSKYLEDITLPFTDVSKDAWYYPYVATAYDYTILSGKSETIFDPNAGLTCAEAAKIAACIHNSQTGLEDPLVPFGDHWYDVYVDYCRRNNIIEENVDFDWSKNATRAEMAYMFSRCDALPSYINEVPMTDIPDVDESTPFANEILDLYNKGIAVGSNEYYAFYPNSNVKRCEAAALISKILCQEMRTELPKG